MTSEMSFELLAIHELERGRLYGSTVYTGGEGALAIEVQPGETEILARVWDTRTGELVLDLPADTFLTEGQKNLGIDAAVSADGSKLALARWYSDDSEEEYCSLRVLDTRTGSVLVSETLGSPWRDMSIRFSGDDRFLLYSNKYDSNSRGDSQGHYKVGVIEVEPGSKSVELSYEDHCFWRVDDRVGMLSSNGRRVVLWDTEVTRIWDVGEGGRSADPSTNPLNGMLIPKRTFGISDASFSSDGSLVLTSGGDGSARIWNVETGAELLKLDHGRHVLRGRFSPDGSRVLTACAGGAIRLWDARNGDLIALLADGGGIEPQIAFTRDGERFISASESGVVLSDAGSCATLARVDGKLLAISVEHDLIVVGGETLMQLRDTRDGSVVWALNQGMTHAAISPDGTRLLCWDAADGDIHDFDVVSGAPVGLFGRPRQGLRSCRLSFNRDGSRVLIFDTASDDDIPLFGARLCNSADGSVIATFERVTALAFSPDGQRLRSCTPWGEAAFFDATQGTLVGALPDLPYWEDDWTELSPDGSRVILLGVNEEPTARIHDAQTGKEVSELRGHTAPKALPVEFDPSGERLLTLDGDTIVRVWEAGSGREVAVLREQYCEKVERAEFSPDLAWVFTRANGQTLVYDPASGTNVAVLTGDRPHFFANGSRALTHANGQTQVWDAASWTQLAVLKGEWQRFSTDGTRLVTRAEKQTRVWDAATWTELAVLRGDKAEFSLDGTRVFTTDYDQTRAWDAVVWTQLAVLAGKHLSFHTDGTRAETYADDSPLLLWDAATWKLQGVIPSGVFRKFSPDGTKLTTHSVGETQVWDTKTWSELALLKGDQAGFFAEGARLLTTSRYSVQTGPTSSKQCDQTHVWDTGTWTELAVLMGGSREFSPDGTRLLTSDWGETRVWDTRAWTQLAVLKSDGSRGLRFSADGTRVVMTDGDQTQVWDTANWTTLAVLKGDWPRFATDGTRLLTRADKQTHVWDAATWTQLVVLAGSNAEFTSDGTRLLTHDGKQTYVWDTRTWTQLAVLKGEWRRLSTDGTRLLTASGVESHEQNTGRGHTHVWDTGTWTQLAILAGGGAEFTSDGTRLLTYDGKQTHVWDAATWTQLAFLAGIYVRFFADGTRVLTSDNGQTRVWATETWTQLAVLEGERLSFSTDGKRLLTASGVQNHERNKQSTEIRVWDTTTWTQLATLAGADAAFSADGTWVLARAGEPIRVLWDTAIWKQLVILPGGSSSTSPDGTRVLKSVGEQTHVWDAGTWTPLAVLQGKDPRFSPDGTRLLTQAGEQTHLWDAGTWAQLAVLPGLRPKFSPDGTRVLTIGYDETHVWTQVWDTTTWTQLTVLVGHHPEFTSEGTRLLTQADEQTHVWDTSSWTQLAVLEGGRESFTSDGTQLFTGVGKQTHVWDTSSWMQLAVLKGRRPIFTADGARVLTEGGGQVEVWDAATWAHLGSFPGTAPRVNYGRMDPNGHYVSESRLVTNGRYILSNPSWGRPCIFDLEKGGVPTTLVGRNDTPVKVTEAKHSPDGSLILTIGDDGCMRLWDPASGCVLETIHVDTTRILAGAKFSPDGKTVLAACGDDSLRLWDVSSGRQLAVMEGHASTVDAFSFSADGQQVVSIAGSTLRRWGAAEGAAADPGAAVLSD